MPAPVFCINIIAILLSFATYRILRQPRNQASRNGADGTGGFKSEHGGGN